MVMNNNPNTGGSLANEGAPSDLPRWIVPAGFVVGCLFLVAVLGIIVAIPKPTSAQEGIFHTVVALAGAGYSMSLTGFLSVRLNLPNKGVLVAGGTLAVFVVLFFFSPNATTIQGNDNIVVQDNSGGVSVTKGK